MTTMRNTSQAPRRVACVNSISCVLLIALFFATAGAAQTSDEKFEHWPVDLKINGTIIIDTGVRDYGPTQWQPQSKNRVRRYVFFRHKSAKGLTQLNKTKRSTTGKNISFLVHDLPPEPDTLVRKALKTVDVVGFQFGEPSNEALRFIHAIKSDLHRFIKKGGALIVDQPIAAALGEFYSPTLQEPGWQAGRLKPGLNLLPNCILHCESDDSTDIQDRVLADLSRHPRAVGISLAHKSMLLLSGRKMFSHGEGGATFMLAQNERQPPRIEKLQPSQSVRQSSPEYLIDLTEWRRDAIDRTLPPFPPAKPKPPFVENGTLIIVGGGGMPAGLMNRLVELAGGKENAKLVYVPCSEADRVGEPQRTVESWKKSGVKNATFIHTKDRNKANTDEAFMAPLKEATGIWFGGGRQWNMADSYYGTKSHKLMKDVLRRGGVIGGSSAGASIQARYLARATPIGNFRIMAPGYERGGLGFISGVAIDQHFTQRGRQKDMTQLVNRYPQLLGIGIDEATAIVVQKSRAEVVGRGKVHFYDRNLPVVPGEPDYIALPEGSSYDLAKRKVLVDATKPSKDRAGADELGAGKPAAR